MSTLPLPTNFAEAPRTAAAPVLAVDGVGCMLGGREVLRDVSFSLEPGTVTSVIGQNGSGKTTLLRCLLRLLPYTGTIELQGQPLKRYSRRKLASAISYVPQSFRLQAPFTVAQFLAMSRYPYANSLFAATVPRSEISESEVLESAIQDTGIAALRDRHISALSGGEQQRVLIASALVQEAELVLLDEPANHLDPRYQDEVFSLLMRLKTSRGLSILAVHHDLNQAVLTSDRVLALREGRIVYDGAAGAVMDSEVLQGIYDMQFTFVPHPTRPVQMVVPRGY